MNGKQQESIIKKKAIGLKKMDSRPDPFPVRMDENTRKSLDKLAVKNDRSTHKEALVAIANHIGMHKSIEGRLSNIESMQAELLKNQKLIMDSLERLDKN